LEKLSLNFFELFRGQEPHTLVKRLLWRRDGVENETA
jgi:hypothetical protein